MDYRIIDENEIDESLESALKRSMCACFPKDVEVFSKVIYWRSVPSYRVFQEKEGTIISHIAVIDRTITVGGKEFRIAGIQSVFVLPEYRGKNICEDIFSLLAEEDFRRDFDYSLLFCVSGLEKFYKRFGYKKLDDIRIVFTDKGGKEQKIDDREIMMWRPVCMKVFPESNINLNGNKW